MSDKYAPIPVEERLWEWSRGKESPSFGSYLGLFDSESEPVLLPHIYADSSGNGSMHLELEVTEKHASMIESVPQMIAVLRAIRRVLRQIGSATLYEVNAMDSGLSSPIEDAVDAVIAKAEGRS